MAKRMASYFPQGTKLAVRNMTMVGGIEDAGIVYADIGAPVALSANLILAGVDTTAGATVTTFAGTFLQSEAQMTRWGRAVSIALATGAGTNTVTIRDYLGQLMSEDIALNGATTVNGKKAFRYIDSVTHPAIAAATLNVGLANIFGLPYKVLSNSHEMKNQHPSANAGTIVAGLQNGTASSATAADVRGTYAPATVLPNGVNTFFLRYYVDFLNAHGAAQYYA
jgi:hypothetical protein